MDSSWNIPISSFQGIGPKRAQLFEKLGAPSAGALLRFFPRAYEDWTVVTPLAQAVPGEIVCLRATVSRPVKEHYVRKGMVLYKTQAFDGMLRLELTFFNNRFVMDSLRPGKEYLFYGRVEQGLVGRQMTSPAFAPVDAPPGLKPIYRQTEGLPSRLIAGTVRQALERCSTALECDPLPEELRREYGLCSFQRAMQAIHFPTDRAALADARKRLVFEELLTLQLGLLRLKGRQRQTGAPRLRIDHTGEFFARLPFAPTGAQKRAVAESVADMKKATPMSRLLQGDVGSGKTAVAAAVMDTAVFNGWQCALMAPTEILAEQHARSLSSFFEETGVKVALLTGSVKPSQKREILQGLADGTIHVAVGTHALIGDKVNFQNLGLVITDEQHRFGVGQRSALAKKGSAPHMLVMSATPIPRTLALMIYGDLDLSVLDELPPGRQTIATYAVGTALRERIYRFIQKHLDQGLQAYIVCPLVEEGEPSAKGAAAMAAAQEYAERLAAKEFAAYRVGLLHGRMNGSEKEAVMRDFQDNRIQLLISTTVVEVGVDVPNAVVMVVENAERFGLSQLHQLRGRVGRGQQSSTCILVSDAQNEEARRRLKVMCDTSDGFRIADEDLKLRGPGDFFGARQHGLPELKIADMLTDTEALRQTSAAAREILERDPKLELPEHRGLAASVDALFSSVGSEGLN